MDSTTLSAVRDCLATGRGKDAVALLEVASRASPDDPRLAHDRLLVATLFGNPADGRMALNAMTGLVERIGTTAAGAADLAILSRDLADVVPLLLARFGSEELAVHIPPVAEQVHRLLAAAALLPHDPETAALLARADALIWRYDDPRTRTRRYVYRPPSPHTVQIEPTNRCNLKCTMCPRTTEMQRPLVDMTVEDYAQLLAGWSGARPGFKARVHSFSSAVMDFTWPGFVKLFFLGEILMHESFIDLVHATRARGAAVMPMTNGALLVRRSIRRKIVDSDMTHLGISLDGIDAASYEAVRTGAAWNAVRDAIIALCDELEAAGRRSSIALHVNTLVPEGPGMAERNKEFLAPILARVDSYGQTHVTAATHAASFVDAQGRLTPVIHAGRRIDAAEPSCLETLTKLNVLSDGRMTPCCGDIDGVLELGRMRQTIDEVWNSPATLALHRAHFTHRLEDYDYCRHCLGVDVDPAIGLVPRLALEGARPIG